MSLNWKWEDKFAIATYDDGDGHVFTRNWYEGNAWMIETREEDEFYTVTSFWSDEEHMKRCLGIAKDSRHGNLYTLAVGDALVKVRIAKDKTHHFKKILPALAQAFSDITIEICSEL